VLVGTTSVASSEQVAAALRKKMGDQAHRLQVFIELCLHCCFMFLQVCEFVPLVRSDVRVFS